MLEDEKRSALIELLGPDVQFANFRNREDLIEQAIMRFLLGPVRDPAPQKVIATLENAERLAREIDQRHRSFNLPEDEEAKRKVQQDTLTTLQRLLSADEFLEFSSRLAALKLMDNDLEYLKASPAEFHEIARMRVEICGPSVGDLRLFDGSEVSEAQNQHFQARLREFLGETRYEELARDRDPDFRTLSSLASERGLSREAALKVYELKSLLEQQRREQLSAAGDESSLAQHQVAALEQVRLILGPKVFEDYLKGGNGAWLTNGIAQ